MRVLRLLMGLICALVIAANGIVPQVALAEGPNACRALVQDVTTAVKASCSMVDAGSVCYGFDAVKATFGSGNAAEFAVGKSIDLASVTSLTTAAANPDKKLWGTALLNLKLGDNQTLRAVLFGEATLTSAVRPDAAKMPTLPVKTFDEMSVVLRAAASTSQPQVLRLTSKVTAVADGRNAKGNWVRVRVEDAVGWAPVSLLTVTGDVNTLSMLEDDDIVAHHLYTNPMQAVTLTNTAKDSCAEASSGLLLQGSNEKPVVLTVNGVKISLDKTTVLVKAIAKESLDLTTLAGKATLRVYGADVELNTGESLKIRLGSKSGFVPIAPPPDKTKPAFANLAGVPTALVADAIPCVTGILSANQKVTTYGGPDTKKYAALAALKANSVYAVLGWNQDANNKKWWKLESAVKTTETWILQDDVTTIGGCGAIAKAEPPVVTAGGGKSTTTAPIDAAGFAPKAKTIWNAEVGNDQLVGACSAGPLNYCAQLVALTPSGNDLLWKGQELKVYTLTRIGTNSYLYSGRNGLGDGNIKMLLVFSSPTNFTMTQTLVLDTEPKCQHVNVFSATLR